jgi:4-hydroxybenzoate polyprenyltransferase
VAGGSPGDAIRLGVAMTAIQVSIGVVNDLVDADRDAGLKAGKPIPAGLVPRAVASAVALVAAVTGLLLSAVSGLGTLALALLGLAIGLAYDLRLKGTAWSWLPFALGLPLLPVYAWFGATGSLPIAFAVLVPAGIAAGAALAIGNARADMERDLAAGTSSIATALGADAAWAVETAVLGAVWLIATAFAAVAGADPIRVVAVLAAGSVPVAAAAVSRGLSPAGRERSWEACAVGVALLAVVWLGVALA